MKYYSEKLNKLFDSEKELIKEEKNKEIEKREEEHKQEVLKKERALKAKEVDEAIKNVKEAYNTAEELINEFVKTYGSFHTTISDTLPASVFNLFDLFKLL